MDISQPSLVSTGKRERHARSMSQTLRLGSRRTAHPGLVEVLAPPSASRERLQHYPSLAPQVGHGTARPRSGRISMSSTNTTSNTATPAPPQSLAACTSRGVIRPGLLLHPALQRQEAQPRQVQRLPDIPAGRACTYGGRPPRPTYRPAAWIITLPPATGNPGDRGCFFVDPIDLVNTC